MPDALETTLADGVAYRLLGALAAERWSDGTPAPIPLGAPKQRAVLALLLLQRGRIVTTERLAEALWGDAPPPSATASIQAYVSNLRRALREAAGATPPIVRRGPGYVLTVDSARLDLARVEAAMPALREAGAARAWPTLLERAEAVLAEWRGAPLEELGELPWVAGEAAALEELRAEAREARIAALLALGHAARATAAAQELRAAHPLRDRGCWLEMVALHAAGRTGDALERYREHARRVDAELGLEPGRELRELQAAILAEESWVAHWPRPDAAAPDAAPSEPPVAERPGTVPAAAAPPTVLSDGAAAVEDELVGRGGELPQLGAVLDDARAGRTRWVVLAGPAGNGKTRLAEEIAARARAAGGREAWGRCSDEDGAPAWWPIRQVVRALGEDPDALLVPPSGVDTDAARFVLYERVAGALERAAGDGPLAIVVDDVQWADETSVRCLTHLAAALRGLPLVVALTLRDDEDPVVAQALLAAVAREGGVQLRVGPLAVAEVGELARRIAGESLSAEQVTELALHTGGNPLFVREYARLPSAERARGDVPLAVRAVLGRRLAGLDPEVVGVLRAAAVAGDAIEMDSLTAATGMDGDALADLLDEAADEHVLVVSPDTGGYAFAHGLLRQQLLEGIPTMRRARLHARIAGALAGDADGDAISRRAHHLLAALPHVDPAEALGACRAAAAVAEQRWSAETAAEWWAAALRASALRPAAERSVAEEDELRVAQIAALARAGRYQTLLDRVDAALLDAVRERRWPTAGALASAVLRAAGAWPWISYGEDTTALQDRLTQVAPLVREDPVAHVRVLAAAAVGTCYDPDGAVPDRRTAEALARAEELGDPAVLADARLARLVSYTGVTHQAERSLAIANALIEEGDRHGDAGGPRLGDAPLLHDPAHRARLDATIARATSSLDRFQLGDVAGATRVVAEAVNEADLRRLQVVRIQLRWMQGNLAAWRGEHDLAAREFAIARRVHGQTELYNAGAGTLSALALQRERGGLRDADPGDAPERDAWIAAIAAERGERDVAGAAVDRWLDAPRPWVWLTLGHAVLVAHAIADAGLADRAQRAIALLEPFAGRIAAIGHVGTVGPVDLALGRLHALAGGRDRALALLHGARELAERTGGRPSVARAHRALAALGA
jgi:DNA-binding SARP family transcriptional activator